MSEGRFVDSLFCDDIRREIGNKFSLMGCYGKDLLLEKLPAVIPKLCVQIRVITPTERPFHEIKIRVIMNDDEVLAEVNANLSESTAASSEDTMYTAMAHVVISPLPINDETKIRVEVDAGEGPMKGGSLKISTISK